ncbi:MAG: FlgD immunoglobulin-like domain containing protein, partial [Candidatus Eisenbacteria bacterium]
TSGHWRPRAYTSVAFPLPAPVAPYLAAAPLGSSTLASAIGSLGNGTWSLYIADDTGGNGGGSMSGGWCLDFDPAIVGVAPFATPLADTRLAPPAPSPMHGLTRLRYSLAAAIDVRLDVLDASGRRVRALRRGAESAGPHDCLWDGRDDAGRALPAGLYFVRLHAGDTFSMQRLALTR